MVKINTSCEDCIFAKTLGSVQVGCMNGFLEKFVENNGEYEINENNYYILNNKCCQYRRYIEWMPSSYEEALVRVKEEVIPKLNVLVYHSSEKQDLQKTLRSIHDANHFHKMNIIVSYSTKNRGEIVELCSIINQAKIKYCSILEDDVKVFSESFKLAKNGYFTTIHSGEEFPKNFLDVLNHAINVEQKLVSYVNPADEQGNLMTVMCVFAQYLKADYLFNMEEKLMSMLEENDVKTKMIFDWKELNDSYYSSVQ